MPSEQATEPPDHRRLTREDMARDVTAEQQYEADTGTVLLSCFKSESREGGTQYPTQSLTVRL